METKNNKLKENLHTFFWRGCEIRLAIFVLKNSNKFKKKLFQKLNGQTLHFCNHISYPKVKDELANGTFRIYRLKPLKKLVKNAKKYEK